MDVKRALARWTDLQVAAEAIWDETHRAGCHFTAVGRFTMGADAIAVAVASVQKAQWFLVRKEPKTRALKRAIEGARLGPGDRVLLVDDMVTTGGSILRAYEEVVKTGAQVLAASALVDRGGRAAEQFEDRGVAYLPVATQPRPGPGPRLISARPRLRMSRSACHPRRLRAGCQARAAAAGRPPLAWRLDFRHVGRTNPQLRGSARSCAERLG